MFFPFILICNKKSKKIFNNNLGIRAVIIYFALCLLINDSKNIYSRNVCIIIFHTNCLYNRFLYILLLFKIISYYEKELCVCLEMCEFCRYAFLVFEKSDEQTHCVRNFQIRVCFLMGL